jgi:hypothetical protein
VLKLKIKFKIIFSIVGSLMFLGSLFISNNAVSDCTTNTCNVTFFDIPPDGGYDCGFNIVFCSTYEDTFRFYFNHDPSIPYIEMSLFESGICEDGCIKYTGSVGNFDCSKSWEWYIRDSQGRDPCP